MTVAVAMSGGVDSSVAAAMLKREGHEVVGFTMQLWNQRRRLAPDEEPQPSRCCSLDDVYDARSVARDLKIPFYVLNLEDEFERAVVRPFVEDYLNTMSTVWAEAKRVLKRDRFCAVVLGESRKFPNTAMAAFERLAAEMPII